MDADIHTTTPSGSPLLAYGTSTSFFGPRKWLRYAIPGGISLFLLGLCAIFYFSIRIQIPQNPLILVVVPGKTTLPNTLPSLWREASQASRLPVLLGASIQNKKLSPFVVTFRSASLKNYIPYSRGLFSLYSESSSSTQAWPASILFKQFFSRNNGSIRLFLSTLHIDGQDIVGAVTKNGWETSTVLPSTHTNLPAGDLVIDLTTFPEATIPIFQALRANGYNFPADMPPVQTISIVWASSTSMGMSITFTEKRHPSFSLLDTGTSMETQSYKLSDDTVFQEYTNTNSNNTPTGSQIGTWDSEQLVWQSDAFLTRLDQKNSCSQGTHVFHIDGEALKHLERLLFIDLPYSQIDISSYKGKMLICAFIN